MTSQFVQDGESIDFVPGADVAAGEVVVINQLVGVAKRPIKSGILGALAIYGVFEFIKTAGAGTGFTQGSRVYWDAVAQVATNASNGGANKTLGKAVQESDDNATAVRVLLVQVFD